MTCDKYTHMMTLIVNSHKMYENDNAKENEMHARNKKCTQNKTEIKKLRTKKSMQLWLCVNEHTVNDHNRGHAYHIVHKLHSIVQKPNEHNKIIIK